MEAAARRTVLRERHKAAALRRHCGSAQPAAVVVGNTWSLDFTAVRPRDYIEESGMGGGREQLVHHYVLVAAAVRCLHSSKMELVQAHAAPPPRRRT